MFADTAQHDGTTLLQGDIVAGVQILGAINLNSITHLTPGSGSGQPTGWQVQQPPNVGHSMVLSHSCEIDRRNLIKVTSIILAPLRDLSTATKPAMIEQLIASNLIDQANPEASFLKYFYLAPHDEIPYSAGAVVDFSKCFSVRNQSFESLLRSKVLQLRDDTRHSMSLKLALYFHREQAAA